MRSVTGSSPLTAPERPPERPPVHGLWARARDRVGARLGVCLAVATLGACKPSDAQLTAPSNMAAMPEELQPAFDDGVSYGVPPSEGRANHDVRDQDLWVQRVDRASLIFRASVLGITQRKRAGSQAVAAVTLKQIALLKGKWPRGAALEQTLELMSLELAGDLVGRDVLVFLRWDTSTPSTLRVHLALADTPDALRTQALLREAEQTSSRVPRAHRAKAK